MFAVRPLLVLASLAVSVLGATYSISDSHVGKDFLSAFTHQAISDPTHGRVYVSQLRLRPSIPLRGTAARHAPCDPLLTYPLLVVQELCFAVDCTREEPDVREREHTHPACGRHDGAERERPGP